MAKLCCVCSESKDTPENPLFSCSSHGCDVTVHQACYGIVNAPSGLWFCRKCESQERAARVRCELCPRKEGALKRTDSGGWAHVVCALYIPEVTFGNNRRMEPIITTKVPKERFAKSCYICEDRGMETQATYGACMACHKSSCRLAFHVTCAQKEHLLCEEEEQRDSRNIVYCGYCSTHYKKIIRPRFNKPTSSTPLLPLPITTTTSHTSTLPGLSKEREHRPPRAKDRELPQKRFSTDAPIPPQKRKYRPRKISSSNESTTSDAPSNTSDIPPRSAPPHAALSPSSVTARSPLSTHTGPVRKIKVEVSESSNTELLQPALSLSHKPEDVPGGESHPFSPITRARASSHEVVSSGVPSGREAVPSRRQGGSTSSDQSSVNKAAVGVGFPPRSLHDLLERQWEQTAQFILDQAGSQNNAGMMLAHLHQLQSENSRMQSRIMELASQREFYIAINTRLRQTLTENDNRLPNGVQPSLGEGIQQNLMVPNTNPNSSTSTTVSDNHNQRAASSDTPVDVSLSARNSSLSKAAQDSLLQAHFLAASLNPPGLHYPLLPAGQGSSVSNTQMRDMELRPQQPNIQHLQQNEALLPTTQGVFPANVAVSQPTGNILRGTPAHESERLGQQPPGSNNDITYVTNSIQVPIATFTPLPGGGMNALPTSISSRPQSSANHSYYSRTLNSNKT